MSEDTRNDNKEQEKTEYADWVERVDKQADKQQSEKPKRDLTDYYKKPGDYEEDEPIEEEKPVWVWSDKKFKVVDILWGIGWGIVTSVLLFGGSFWFKENALESYIWLVAFLVFMLGMRSFEGKLKRRFKWSKWIYIAIVGIGIVTLLLINLTGAVKP